MLLMIFYKHITTYLALCQTIRKLITYEVKMLTKHFSINKFVQINHMITGIHHLYTVKGKGNYL